MKKDLSYRSFLRGVAASIAPTVALLLIGVWTWQAGVLLALFYGHTVYVLWEAEQDAHARIREIEDLAYNSGLKQGRAGR